MKFSEYSSMIEQRILELSLPGGDLGGLYEPIAYSMSAGGKRIRPVLVLMTADAFGNNAAEAENAAIGLEMFHNFTLLHDDVMDNSELRRGRPSVFAKWDVNTAILSGDTMLTLASQLVAEVSDSILRKVLDAFNDMALRVYEGQRLDMDFEQRDDVTADDYIRMISFKTGALLGASCAIGALIGGASDEDAAKMAEYGIMLGIAFQIQDDRLDVFGDTATFGKPIGGDINNNKKSYLLLSGLSGSGPEAAALAEAMRLPAGALKVKTVTRIYEKMNMPEICGRAVADYSARALAALKATSLSDERREPFRLLVEKLTGRRK
ncbi:MAG: polyprenyl synthetase family protein [Candidatus Amulumruptor caecigallinarius]|nr:polyprenyl synthetase family protein [Candidatus Amulumruptor caecigallinarius]